MNAAARTARKVIKARAAQTRLTASLNRGRSLSTHCLAAGLDAATTKGVVSSLRTVAKRLHIAPVKTSRTHRTVTEAHGRMRTVQHFTTAQVRLIVAGYNPRKAEYVAAKHALAA